MSASVEHSDDKHVWTFTAHRVTQLHIAAGGWRLESWSLHDWFEVKVNVPFRLTLADGSHTDLDPATPTLAAPLLALIGREIVRLVVTLAGSLDVSLSNGARLVVASHPRRQAFEVNGGGALEGMEYVARVGGGLVWGVGGRGN